VAGKTKEELTNELVKNLTPFLMDPIVTVRQLNFDITVVGEVNAPGTFNKPDEHMTLLAAIGHAGGLTQFGNMENVLLIREKAQGQEYTRINLNNRYSIPPEIYYLKANDIVYVEAKGAKKFKNSLLGGVVPALLSTVTVLFLSKLLLK
jgi:polysaccharide export outer membrane protein